MEQEFQVKIHNCITSSRGKKALKVLSIKASELPVYVDNLRKEGDTKFFPNRHKQFEGYPLLVLADSFETGEEFVYKKSEDLPSESVFNSLGMPVLIIIPESEPVSTGINRFDLFNQVKHEKFEENQEG